MMFLRSFFPRPILVLLTLLVANVALGQEVLFQSNFGSEDGFVVLPSSDDSEFEFDYDYSEFDGIPEAPNSGLTGGDAQRGLKLEANISESAFSAIAIATDGLALTGQYAVQVDVWLNFNFPAGTAGTTEFGGLAVGHDAVALGFGGASFVYDTDGDSGSDFRLYKDSTFQSLGTGQYAVESLESSDEPFVTAFPGVDIETAVPKQSISGTTSDGAGGFRWMTVEALVDTEAVGVGNTDDKGVTTFSLTDADSKTKIEIGSIDNSNGEGIVSMSGEAAVIFSDIFTCICLNYQI